MRGVPYIRTLVVTAAMLATLIANALPVRAISVQTAAPLEPPTSQLKVSAYDIALSSEPTADATDAASAVEYIESVRYIELYNDSSEPVNLGEYAMQVTDTHGVVIAGVQFADVPKWTGYYLPPGAYVTVSFNGVVAGAQFDFANDDYLWGTTKPLLDREIQLFRGGNGVYAKSIKLKIDSLTPQVRLVFSTVTAEEQTAEALTVYDTPLYMPMREFPLTPVEVLANPKTCGPLDTVSECQEYVKFYNSTESQIKFEGTRLRVGYLGQTSSTSNTVALSGSIDPGAYAIFTVPITNSGGYIWLEDMYGVMPFENTIVEYPDASATSKKGFSWAVIDGLWQWAIPNPGGANTPMPVEEEKPVQPTGATLTPCRADQYRNPETNRCKLISSISPSPTPCAANQTRNPETNRCRLNGSSISSSLTPCKSNQYRNPETNRCKSIASTASALVPCAPNQERNPETNRCRNTLASAMPTADFPVDQKQMTDNQSLGWIAFAGVGVMAAGYAGWEWRYEIAGFFRTLRRLVTKA